MLRHAKNEEVTDDSQRGFIMVKLCLKNLVASDSGLKS